MPPTPRGVEAWGNGGERGMGAVGVKAGGAPGTVRADCRCAPQPGRSALHKHRASRSRRSEANAAPLRTCHSAAATRTRTVRARVPAARTVHVVRAHMHLCRPDAIAHQLRDCEQFEVTGEVIAPVPEDLCAEPAPRRLLVHGDRAMALPLSVPPSGRRHDAQLAYALRAELSTVYAVDAGRR